MLFSQGEKKGHASFCLMRDKLYLSSTSTENRTSLILWELEPERLLYKYSIAIDLLGSLFMVHDGTTVIILIER